MITPSKYIIPLTLWSIFAIFSENSIEAAQKDESNYSSLVRCFSQTEKPAAPFADGKFAPHSGETISFIGGTNTFDLQKYPYFETLLQVAYPKLQLKTRNLVWQGDTVLHQTRPLFYFTQKGDKREDSVPDQRKHIEPGIVFVNFGKMESLEGKDSLQNFLKAYKTFLDHLASRSQRIVLLSPTPFFPVGPAKKETQIRNQTLAKFVEAIQAEAKERHFIYLDQFTPLMKNLDPSLSSDGIHLTDAGQKHVAQINSQALHFPINASAALNSNKLQTLQQSLQRKNFLWQQYYHPTNWAFLYGDRQNVPASRSHLDKNKRWFIEEVAQLPSLITETEADIHRYASEAAASISQ